MGSRDETTGSAADDLFRKDAAESAEAHALLLAWSRHQPTRVGEIAFVPQGLSVLGRGAARADDTIRRVSFDRRRVTEAPRPRAEGPELTGPRLSREQLRFRVNGADLEVERTGRLPLLVNGEPVNATRLEKGDTLHLSDELVLLVTSRPVAELALPNLGPGFAFPFGAPDPFGLVGESPAAWLLRDRIGFAASRGLHVMLFGESGVGKELVARAVHAKSERCAGPLVSRNAATLPAGLIDAELFGNAKNYPHAGMAERPGLVGEAHGGTLFLDEIAELPEELQAHLLRLLDAGEYQRLGDAKARRSDLRLVAATNRDASALKHDLLARLKLVVDVPPLSARVEDVPLLVRHLLGRVADADASMRARFFEETAPGSSGPSARIEPALVDGLLRHRFALNVRELESLLWTSMASSRQDFLALTEEVDKRLAQTMPRATRVEELTAEAIEEALARHGGSQARAYKDLGLRTRDQLYRLMKKLGVGARRG